MKSITLIFMFISSSTIAQQINYKCKIKNIENSNISLSILKDKIVVKNNYQSKTFQLRDPGLYSYYGTTTSYKSAGSRAVDIIRLDQLNQRDIEIEFGTYYIEMENTGESDYRSGLYYCQKK